MRLFLRGSTTNVLLVLLAATCLPSAHAGVIEDWDNLVIDHVVQNKVYSNVAARLLAITHLAQWRAINEHLNNKGVTADKAKTDPNLTAELEVVAASAAKAATTGIIPAANASIDSLFAKHVKDRDGGAFKAAVDRGAVVGQAVLQERADDGADKPLPAFIGSNETGKWRPTPPAFAPALLKHWGNVRPFVMDRSDEFRSGPPPALDSDVYFKGYDEVLLVGNVTSSTRTADQADCAVFWSSNPEVLWAKVTQQVTANLSIVDAAKVHLLSSSASADSRIASWDTKWTHLAWRPATAIPVGNAQGWRADTNWKTWVPTPPTPEWPSAHTATAESVAAVLRNVTGSDKFRFTLSSYTLPDKPPRTYDSFSAASDEMGSARIWAGVHYRHAITEAETQGQNIGRKALEKYGGLGSSPAAAAAPAKRSLLRSSTTVGI